MTNSWNGQLEGCSISSSKLKESLILLEYLQKIKKIYIKEICLWCFFQVSSSFLDSQNPLVD